MNVKDRLDGKEEKKEGGHLSSPCLADADHARQPLPPLRLSLLPRTCSTCTAACALHSMRTPPHTHYRALTHIVRATRGTRGGLSNAPRRPLLCRGIIVFIA